MLYDTARTSLSCSRMGTNVVTPFLCGKAFPLAGCHVVPRSRACEAQGAHFIGVDSACNSARNQRSSASQSLCPLLQATSRGVSVSPVWPSALLESRMAVASAKGSCWIAFRMSLITCSCPKRAVLKPKSRQESGAKLQQESGAHKSHAYCGGR